MVVMMMMMTIVWLVLVFVRNPCWLACMLPSGVVELRGSLAFK